MSDRPFRPILDEQIGDLEAWFPEDRWKVEPPPDLFEIALVLAGGQSAGCYLAGVLDFLFEALDCWRDAVQAEAKLPADQRSVPNHRVKVKIVVGASAGGLNAALAAICARYRLTPASEVDFHQRDKNFESPFYRAWVCDIDISNLLDCDDLKDEKGAFSALNTAYLEGKVRSYLDFGSSGVPLKLGRDWVEDPLPFKITISNLDGVPYRISFTAGDQSALWMSLHRDHVAFLRPLSLPVVEPTIPDHEVLTPANRETDSGWHRVGDAVLATIAFPFALQQRTVSRPSTDYDYRYVFPSAGGGLVFAKAFPNDRPFHTKFVTIDGGTLNERPFDLAHAALAGSQGTNRREGNRAKRAVVMVDPFASPPIRDENTEPLTLPRFVKLLWRALIDQGRFDPIDVSLAEADEVYSRFLVAPSRHDGEHEIEGNEALASHPLGAFLGYFSLHYRHHDFMLGRRNCQKFLRDWFALPSRHGTATESTDFGNDLFAGWPTAALANQAFRSQLHANQRLIIPLLGSAAEPHAAPRWPAGQFEGFSGVEREVKARLEALWPRVRDQIVDGAVQSTIGRWFARAALNLYFMLSGKSAVLAAIAAAVDAGRDKIDGKCAELGPKNGLER